MSQSRPAAVVVLAAGEGTRMRSTTPKVLHGFLDRSMLGHSLSDQSPPSPIKVEVDGGGDKVEIIV